MCLAYHLRKTLSMYRKMPKENLTFIHETISIKFVKNKFNELNNINDEVKSMTKSFDEQAKQQIDAAKHEIISSIAETMDLYGVTPSVGTLYATLYLNDEMNLDEMRTELNMSKPSMSTGIRKLHNNGMVKKVHQTETRKHVYTAEKDFFKSFMSYYCQMWQREVDMNMAAIHEAKEHLQAVMDDETVSEEVKNEAQEYYTLIDHSRVYYNWLEKLTRSVKTGEIFSFLPKDPLDDES